MSYECRYPGVSFIVMPCNSTHRSYDRLAASIDVPLLNIIEETVRRVDANRRTTIMGTRATLASGLYQQSLADALANREQDLDRLVRWLSPAGDRG